MHFSFLLAYSVKLNTIIIMLYYQLLPQGCSKAGAKTRDFT